MCSSDLAVKDFLSSLEKQVQDADSSLAAEEQLLRETATRLESEAAGETETRAKIQKSQKIRPASAQQFAPGTEIFYGPGKQRGVLLRQAKKGYWIVELGSIKMTLPESELQFAAPQKPQKVQVLTQVDLAQAAPPSLELNLRGYRLETALEALRKQIDGAALSGLYEFSVIHGKGDGILQRGVHEFLKQHPLVADYYFARPEEGGFGKTLVFLKRS